MSEDRKTVPGTPSTVLSPGAFDAFDTEEIEARSMPESPISVEGVRSAGYALGDLWLPAVVMHDRALTHNLDRFARWCARHGVELAPHGKTTMSPHLWSAQLGRGAWALTAATAAQARVMHRFGVGRVLIANEVVEPGQLAWLARSLEDPWFEPLMLVDSLEGIERAEEQLSSAGRKLGVLIELGVAGRRTGVRTHDEALALAERIAAGSALRLAGIEGYEGVLPQRRDAESIATAREWLDQLSALVIRADQRGLFAGSDEVVVTAGGSGYPDLAANALTGMAPLSRPVRPVIRSGCYLTHDDLSYERSSPLRSGGDADPLVPALSCYARVISCPEPGRALLGVGKRDVAFDLDLPLPRSVLRSGERIPVDAHARMVELNDHHGFCDTSPDLLAVGDVVELGLSHPCTVFDKWSLIPVLDKHERVVDAIRTCF